MPENIKHWIKGFLFSFFIFLLLLLYLYLRRGYINIYILNKAFGSAAAVCGGLTLLIGPISHRFNRLHNFMTIRREIGIFAFIFALIHIVASLLQQNRFPLFGWYLEEIIPVTFGIIAILIWIYMAFISRNSEILKMGSDNWRRILSMTGKVSFVAIFLHLTIMKYPGWVRWLNGELKRSPQLENPTYPPASIFVFAIMAGVIIYRVINFIVPRKKLQ